MDEIIARLTQVLVDSGPWAAVCVLLVLAIWRFASKTITRFTAWAEPKATAVVQGHIKLVDTLDTTQKTLAENITRQSETLEKQSETLASHGMILARHSEMLSDLHQSVVATPRSRTERPV